MRIFILRVGLCLNLRHRSVAAFTFLSGRLRKFSRVVVAGRALHLSGHTVLHRTPARVGASAAKAEQESRAAKSGIKNFFMLIPLCFEVSGSVSAGFQSEYHAVNGRASSETVHTMDASGYFAGCIQSGNRSKCCRRKNFRSRIDGDTAHAIVKFRC